MQPLTIDVSQLDDVIASIKDIAVKVAKDTLCYLNGSCKAPNCDCSPREVSFDFEIMMPPEPHRHMFSFFVEHILFNSGAYSEVTFKQTGKKDNYNVHVHAFRKSAVDK
jgi:hypothetical protein